MNSLMQISVKQSRLSFSLANMIKELDLSSLSIYDLHALIEEHIQTANPDICDICQEPYIEAIYFANGECCEDFRGGAICRNCLEKGMALLRSKQ